MSPGSPRRKVVSRRGKQRERAFDFPSELHRCLPNPHASPWVVPRRVPGSSRLRSSQTDFRAGDGASPPPPFPLPSPPPLPFSPCCDCCSGAGGAAAGGSVCAGAGGCRGSGKPPVRRHRDPPRRLSRLLPATERLGSALSVVPGSWLALPG